MAYTKNHATWADSDTITTTVMDNFETIYTETSSYLGSHTHDDLYETKTEMNAKYWYAGNDGTGSGADADGIYYNGGAIHGLTLASYSVPMGLIILWYGSVASIPAGWSLCNGTAGTPDLTDKFVIGAGSAYAVGATGGSNQVVPGGTLAVATHVLTEAEMGSHIHPFSDMYASAYSSAQTYEAGSLVSGSPNYLNSGNTSSTGSGEAHGHSTAEGSAVTNTSGASSQVPFCYALAYIMKTS
jgi:hypothetical protein